jgi:hypothetical protein
MIALGQLKQQRCEIFVESGINAVTVIIAVNVARGIHFILAGCQEVFIDGGHNLTMSYRV